MDIRSVFFNESNRLRSGWRFAIFLVSYLALSLIYLLYILPLLKLLPIGLTDDSVLSLVTTFSYFSAVAIFLGWLCGKVFEDLPFRALGCWFTENWLRDLAAGLLLGAVSIGLAALIAAVFGGLRFQPNDAAGASAILLTLGVTLLIFTIGAVSEEVLFRGYLLQTFSRAHLVWLGMLLTSFLFASAHNSNPGASAFSWLNTFLAGIWFVAAYLKTRNLWFPFGIHLAWNWFQGAFFGISVSGLGELASAPILKPTGQGAVFVTGGDYGVEGGLACTIAIALSTALIYFLPFLKPTAEMLALTSAEKPEQLINEY